ncbi:hypothetical protein AAVH_17748 [Aphelenchoides avenae]|nr:hypothetical protein AAVH_17748 [Aphelenchus avenae]
MPRLDLDKCQLLSRGWNRLVGRSGNHLPLHDLHLAQLINNEISDFTYTYSTFGESDAINYMDRADSAEQQLYLFMPLRNAHIRLLMVDRYKTEIYDQLELLRRQYGPFKVERFLINLVSFSTPTEFAREIRCAESLLHAHVLVFYWCRGPCDPQFRAAASTAINFAHSRQRRVAIEWAGGSFKNFDDDAVSQRTERLFSD